MSIRLLTTALVLLLQAPGQKPADLPQDPTVTCAPVAEVVITADGPVTLDAIRAEAASLLARGESPGRGVLITIEEIRTRFRDELDPRYPGVRENLYRSEEAEAGQPLLFQNIELDDDGIATLLPTPEEGWIVVQNEPRYQDDVFPLHRLAEDWEPAWQLGAVSHEDQQPDYAVVHAYWTCDWSCQQLGLMVLHQLCPPLRLCSVCQVENDPSVDMMGQVVRQCGALWSDCFVQAPCPGNQGCPYYHPPTYYPATYYCPEEGEVESAIEDCSAAQPEELTVLPQDVESAEEACSCCNKKCTCKSKCGCEAKSDQCRCCNEKCSCGKGKSTKLEKKTACCCTSAKVKVEGKCRCSNCSQDENCCCCDECACPEGACSCGKTFKVKFASERQCNCKDCAKGGKCSCDKACGCKDGACKCQAGKCQCKDCGKAAKCRCDNACGCKDGACKCQAGKCQCKDCGKGDKCSCDNACGCKKGACQCGKTAASYECPHLKAQQARREPVKHEVVRQFTALENLERISQARELFQKAEQLRQAGRHEAADLCYRKAVKAAPGSRYEVLAKAAIANMDEQQTLAKLSLLEKAKQALKQGNVADAYQLAEQAYGEAYAIMSQAQALLRVIDCERFQTTIEEPSEELPCGPQGKARDEVPAEVKVAEYLEAGHRALTAGCISDAVRLAEMALQLDPNCPAARYLLDRAQKMVQFDDEQEEVDHCQPQSGQEPCEDDPEARLCPTPPPIDCTISAVLQQILIDAQKQAAGEEPCAEEQSWQLIDLYVDPEECDGYAPARPGSESTHEPHAACVTALVGQLIQALSGGHCIEIDTASSQGPRVWLQLGAANCRWSVCGGGHIHVAPGAYYDGCEEAEQPCTNEVPAKNGPDIKVQIAGPCEINIHIKWAGTTDTTPAADAKPADQRDVQAVHEQEVLHWIESMNSGETQEEPDTAYEEDEINLDPCD